VPVASITSFVGDHGLYAVFALMVAAAIVPAASELVMIYAGSLAATGHVALFGQRVSAAVWVYVAVAIAGLIGNAIGAVAGWALGVYGGRPLLDRYGRWLHVTPARLDRAERRLERYELAAVPLGFLTPGLRSFVAIPAGIVRLPLARFVPLAVAGCAAFCFGLAGGGWALGSSYGRLHDDLRYVYVGVGVGIVALAAYAIVRRRRSTRLAGRAEDPAH
jgi:membrane protein DedA with SNARE-associated domain